MANDKIALRAEAKNLGIDGYRKLSLDELRAAIKGAKGSPAKGKAQKGRAASKNGTKGQSKGKAAVAKATASKGKSSAAKGKAVPAKSTKTASKGRATGAQAKRQPSAGKGRAIPKARRANEGTAAKIDRKSVDWKASWSGGQRGTRQVILKSLRKHKGNYDKVYAELEPQVAKMYPKSSRTGATYTQDERRKLLRWNIGRVAFDFVMGTNQHKPGSRAGYGESDKPLNVRRREARQKAARAAKRAGSAQTKAAGTKGRSKPQKAAKGKATPKARASKGRAVAKGKGKR